MKIENIKVYGIEETMIASGLPHAVNEPISSEKRMNGLASSPIGSGHDCALKGITFQCNITASQVFWLQFGRYHFADIVSSQSKMHNIMKFDVQKQCNDYVDKLILNRFEYLIELHQKTTCEESFHKVIYNCPSGFELTARITTNYLQLKTMYSQRKTHRLYEWKEFCEMVEDLPYSSFITQK